MPRRLEMVIAAGGDAYNKLLDYFNNENSFVFSI
jgi:hypothetical protein